MFQGSSLPCQGDEAVALFAAGQFGLVSAAQARRAGLGVGDVAVRLRRGMWARTLHWGVYRVAGYGALGSPLKRAVMAAQLALAPGAFACRDTAARLWGLDGLPPWDGRTVDIALRGRPRSRGGRSGLRGVAPGVRIHRLRVADSDVVRRAPLWLTGVGRTLRDMAGCSGPGTSSRLCGSALERGLVSQRPRTRLPARSRAACDERAAPRRGHDGGDGADDE
ncbi:hypothetical protein HNR12_004113 [Streptomonospora nanhaiensis]|uniref:AbiEi antitoxin C-terminal domain-containing protein n=1 Tax=Streptomonospora nanhaiensis TaxID=1323731 RepID=A0A853BSZ5_9ACTN|nr:hypothetical protein [Streptomonospora nanhaiensis]